MFAALAVRGTMRAKLSDRSDRTQLVVNMRIFYCVDSAGRKRRTRDVLNDWRRLTVRQGPELATYLVDTVGYVLLERTERFLRVRVNLDVVSETAFAALCYELSDQQELPRLPVFIGCGDNTIFRFSGVGPGIEFIAARMRDRAPVAQRRYDRRSASLNGASREVFRCLAAMCSSRRVFDSALVRKLLVEAFDDRYVVVRPNPDNGRLLLAEAGNGYPRFNAELRQQDGRPFGEFSADPLYSTFVQQAYREAWSKQGMVLEDIEATLPSVGELPPALTRYERILIPVRSAQGPALLSATMMRT